MNETDPYLAPQTEVYANRAIPENLQGLDFMRLKKLYHRSSNVNVITFLLGLGCLVLLGVSLAPPDTIDQSMRPVFIGLGAFYAAAAIGLFMRTAWGRVLGIIVSIISLVSIPIGTIIGLSGLFAFFGSPELFGANRFTHKELKAEYKLQKAELKMQKANRKGR